MIHFERRETTIALAVGWETEGELAESAPENPLVEAGSGHGVVISYSPDHLVRSWRLNVRTEPQSEGCNYILYLEIEH